MRRIIETPMMPIQLSGKHRACFIGVSANRNYRFNGARKELVHVLGMMLRNIDSYLRQSRDRHGMHIPRWLRPSALHIQDIARRLAQYPFG